MTPQNIAGEERTKRDIIQIIWIKLEDLTSSSPDSFIEILHHHLSLSFSSSLTSTSLSLNFPYFHWTNSIMEQSRVWEFEWLDRWFSVEYFGWLNSILCINLEDLQEKKDTFMGSKIMYVSSASVKSNSYLLKLKILKGIKTRLVQTTRYAHFFLYKRDFSYVSATQQFIVSCTIVEKLFLKN